MKKVAYRIVTTDGDPISQWTDIQFMGQAKLHESRVIEFAYAAPVVTDEMVERACKAAFVEVTDFKRADMRAALTAALESTDAD